MEAAANKVELLTERILPERPYTLSLSIERRYRILTDKDNYIEEWHHRPLQYSTLVADGDRGICFTRPYYDMREDPPIPVPATKPVPASEKKNVTKLSLSDYKNKQKKSLSPPEPSMASKVDRDRGSGYEQRKSDQHKRAEDTRQRDALGITIDKPHRHREGVPEERPAKHHSRDVSNQHSNESTERRKRAAEADDDSRAPKRTKADLTPTPNDRSRTPSDATPRRKDPHMALDKTPQRDGSNAASSALANGRSILKAATEGQKGLSPISRPRGDSVNGHKTSAGGSAKNTPTKGDLGVGKPTVPPLLSPLRLSIGETEPLAKTEKKRPRDDDGDYAKPAKASRLEPPLPVKRQKSPYRIPPLLSPTLPAMLEEELAKFKKTPTKKPEAGRRSTPSSDSPSSGKKAYPGASETDGPRRMIVTLKYSRKVAKRVQRLLALSIRKDVRNERSVSTEAPPAQARKRPTSAAEVNAESGTGKRPRSSEMGLEPSSRLAAPSTPSKSGTAMTRMESNNSQAQTPGDANTPGAPASQERPPTSHGGPPNARIERLKEKHQQYIKWGTNLKHERDRIIKSKEVNDSGGPPPLSEEAHKLSVVLGLECVMSFMIAFRAQTDWRHMEKKAVDSTTWQSTLRLLSETRHHARRSRPVWLIYCQLYALCLEEMLQCFWYMDVSAQGPALIKYERERVHMWRQAHDASKSLDRPGMSVAISPGTGVEEAVKHVLKILRRYADDEDIEWEPTISLQPVGSALNGA